MSKKGGKGTGGVVRKDPPVLIKDAPWREINPNQKPIPKIHVSPLLRVPKDPFSDYAQFVMKNPNPIGSGLGTEAIVEAAGPDCIIPGQITPIRLLGLKVWPIDIDLKFLDPVGRELQHIGKFMDSAVNLMDKALVDR
ncbi:Transcription factor MYB48-like [Heracleum sosnowskyi]|uniref:Transcription factor MYB48-like n=1 Tax=Heracleum sosnowskyi TaxID=360622 RepID=A0AAD8ISB6_9APIA|nr:Transcription factor MYB48-like [Heracleum sosnowskyi]